MHVSSDAGASQNSPAVAVDGSGNAVVVWIDYRSSGAGDVYAQFESSFVIPFHAYMEIVGSEATLIIPKPFKPGVKEKIFLIRDEKTETIKVKGQELYLGEVEDMADAILLGKMPRVTLDDSRANVAAIKALLESAHTGAVVKM